MDRTRFVPDAGAVMKPFALTDLYAAVPAAEEEDLLEQLKVEREQAAREELVTSWFCWPCDGPKVWNMWSGAPTDDDADPTPPEEDPDEEVPPLPQVLGLLREQLGATKLPDEPGGVRIGSALDC